MGSNVDKISLHDFGEFVCHSHKVLPIETAFDFGETIAAALIARGKHAEHITDHNKANGQNKKNKK
jgi:hypothetical protein